MAATTQIGIVDPISYNEKISCTYYITTDFENPTQVDKYIMFSKYSKLGYINFNIKSGEAIEYRVHTWPAETKLATITSDHCPLVATQNIPAYITYRTIIENTIYDYNSSTVITLKGYTSGGKNYIDICSSSILPLDMSLAYNERRLYMKTAFILQ